MRPQHGCHLGPGRRLLMRRARGFTLLELLLVCAIIGILSGLGVMSLRNAILNARLSEGSAQLAADLQRARSSAQRYNRDSVFSISGSPATSYTLTLNGGTTNGGTTQTRALPPDVKLTTTARTITYTAPFGELGVGDLKLILEMPERTDKTRVIKVLGVTGKVYLSETAN